MQFSKMHALGNDFMVVDAITQNAYFSPETIRYLADRHRGVGFDQLLVVEPPYDPELDFHYRIFNADGSEVAQCGNGARCFAKFVHYRGLTNKKNIKVSTKNNKMVLSLLNNGLIKVDMGEPKWHPKDIPFTAQKFEKHYLIQTKIKTFMCGVTSIGNPHCILKVEDIKQADVIEHGQILERHERFPERTNVGFMQIIRDNFIKLRVFERGVGETQACGSGACGAVAVGIMQGHLSNKVKVELPGGELQIEWQGEGSPLYMIGSAKHVYDGFIRL